MQFEEHGSILSSDNCVEFHNSTLFSRIIGEKNKKICSNSDVEASGRINAEMLKGLANLHNVDVPHSIDNSASTTFGLTSCQTGELSKLNGAISSDDGFCLALSQSYTDNLLPPQFDSKGLTSQALSSENVYSAIARPPLCAKPLFFRNFLHPKQTPEKILAEEAVGMFIGQLPSTYLATDIKALLRAIGNEQGHVVHVHDVKCHNRERTCAFVKVNAGALQAILSFTKRILCDVNCVWVVTPSQVSQLPLFIQEMPRELLRCVPKVPLVLEKITQQAKTKHRTSNGYPFNSDLHGPPKFPGVHQRNLAAVLAPPPLPPPISLPNFTTQPFFVTPGYPEGVDKSPAAMPSSLPCSTDPYAVSFDHHASFPFVGSMLTAPCLSTAAEVGGSFSPSYPVQTILWMDPSSQPPATAPRHGPRQTLVNDTNEWCPMVQAGGNAPPATTNWTGVMEGYPNNTNGHRASNNAFRVCLNAPDATPMQSFPQIIQIDGDPMQNTPVGDPRYAYVLPGNDGGANANIMYWIPANRIVTHLPQATQNSAKDNDFNPLKPTSGSGSSNVLSPSVNSAA